MPVSERHEPLRQRRGGLDVPPIVPVVMTGSEPPSLDGVWLSERSAVIEYFVNLSFVVARVAFFLSLFLFLTWYLLSLFIYVFQRNPAAFASAPASSDLLRPLRAHAHTRTHVGRRRSITDLSAAGTGVYLTGRLDE